MYFGERNHTFGRKPDPEKEQLAEQNALLKEQLRTQRAANEKARRVSKKQWLQAMGITAATIAVATLTLFGILFVRSHKPQSRVADPVPLNVRQSVGFDMYFPDPAKLPAGYHLDTSSFSTGNGAIVYKITHGSGHALVVTVQPKLSATEMQQFYKVHMPLTIPIKTSIGPAALGVLNNETVVSLPTNTNAWMLMTAPLSASQKELGQVVQSMTLAQ